MNTFSLIRDMTRYWRRPVFIDTRERLDPGGVVALIGLVGMLILAMFPLGGLIRMLLGEMPAPSEAFADAQRSPNFILLAVIIAPIREELLFRSWLGFRRGLLLVLPILVTVFCSLGVLARAPNPEIGLGLCLAMTLLLVAYLTRYQRLHVQSDVTDRAAHRVFPWIFWGCAIVFGLIHIGNFASELFAPLWLLVVTPHILVGLVLGYVRMRFGLLVAVGFHAAYNLVIVMMMTAALNALETAPETAAMLAL